MAAMRFRIFHIKSTDRQFTRAVPGDQSASNNNRCCGRQRKIAALPSSKLSLGQQVAHLEDESRIPCPSRPGRNTRTSC
jgi:hypothetical protein